MSRPASKKELLTLSQNNFRKLNDYIDSLSEEEKNREFPKGTLNRNIRDVLAHLHHWHKMMLDWYAVGMDGGKPEMPAKGYTWKMLPDLNFFIWQKYLTSTLSDVREMLSMSYGDLQNLINNHTDQELFEKQRFKWTGTTSLGAYFVSATSSHYDWAYKLIKKAKKKQPAAVL